MSIVIRRPWTRQPQTAVTLNPVFGAIAAVLPMGGLVRNISRRLSEPLAAATGANINVGSDILGLGAGSTSQNTNTYRLHSVANQTNTVWERPSSAVTVLAFIIRYGNAAGNAPIFGNTSPNAAPYSAWNLMDSGGTGTAKFECSAGGVYREANASVTITNNKPTVLIGRYNGSAAEIFQNGISVGSAACSGSITYPNDASSRGPGLGNFWNYTAANRAFVGRVFLAALWDRALADSEVTALSLNPWQLFDPQTQRIWVPSAAAGGLPTLSNSTYVAGSLTSTGWRPQITAS